MKFTTKNKLKKEDEISEMISDVIAKLFATSITEEALEDLENHPDCLEGMVKIAVAEDLSVEETIKIAFIHGYKHAVMSQKEGK
jgi:hypothetical protein